MHKYKTAGGVEVVKQIIQVSYEDGINKLIPKLDHNKGVLLVSNFEYPGRYTRWDLGFINPPLQIITKNNIFEIEALNERGIVLLSIIKDQLEKIEYIKHITDSESLFKGEIKNITSQFAEEMRSKRPSIFSILRKIINTFYSEEDQYLGLYGAFGYDLAFQFEDIERCLTRSDDHRDLVLYLPDEILVVDHRKETSILYNYDFNYNELSTIGLLHTGISQQYIPKSELKLNSDHTENEYVNTVLKAKQAFKCGDLFEVVPSQMFTVGCQQLPSEVFMQLKMVNPSPYSFFINLGESEYLVGASPEMYVRVIGKKVETCPISGTIARGRDALEDASQILTLLNSKKDYSELTMCTDVDRNDKSRVCKPGSVKVIGRRHIEMYSRLIHTVDHVEGELKDGYDAIDAFLTHAWAVTVTGAPKLWAMRFLEQHEKSPRIWYGGAIGCMAFNGDMNTGLTIRTVRIKNGIAGVRVGATLLYDSIPEDEEKETRLKASAMLAILAGKTQTANGSNIMKSNVGAGKKILLVDHQDSFVHTLANYLSSMGATVTTLRFGFDFNKLNEIKPDLIVLSPGPGKPTDFNLNHTIKLAIDNNIPIFGVCLGLQGIVEYFDGKLKVLDFPMHGKSAKLNIKVHENIFSNIDSEVEVGLYHSLYADKDSLPNDLIVMAESEYGIIMAIAHKKQPIWAVQFHPESLLSLDNNNGFKILENVLRMI